MALILTVVDAAVAYAQDSTGAASTGGGTQANDYAGAQTTGASQYGHRSRHRRGHHARHLKSGVGYYDAAPPVAGPKAQIVNGLAYPPAGAPPEVVAVIQAANKIVGMPYRYGGGHQSFHDSAYDCSGSVSYALHGAQLVKSPLASSDFESWGDTGPGMWITVYTNPGHAYVDVAGIRFDTSSADDPHASSGSGPRWRPLRHSNSGYDARHPTGL
ncbi:MAG TPA: hypothetical protein VGY97_03830 [Solirubrobacteraceae bacterium]|jgi:hypothetical protein|nr:hypothetical protein [Solirubrobacteraceae bacterium]